MRDFLKSRAHVEETDGSVRLTSAVVASIALTSLRNIATLLVNQKIAFSLGARMSDPERGDVDLSLLATTAKGLLDQLIGLDGDASSQAELVTKLEEIVIALKRLRPALPLKH